MRVENPMKQRSKWSYLNLLLFAMVVLIVCFPQVLAQDNPNGGFLISTIFKLEKKRDSIKQEIQVFESEIRRADINIQKSENIIQRAREQNNAKAEQIALNALLLSKDAKERNTSAKTAAENALRQIEVSLWAATTELQNPIPNMENFEATMSGYTGRTTVQKADGTTFSVGKGRPLFLKKGDVVTTDSNSGLELQNLGGRGTVKLSENTKIEMGDDSEAEFEFFKLLKGKVDVAVENLEAFEKDFEKLIKNYEQDLKTVKDDFKAKIVKEYRSKRAAILKYRNKLEIRTPSGGCCAIRATRFSVKVDEIGNEEVVVTEGIVELKPPKEEKKVILKAGEKATISKDGIISKSEKAGG